MPSERRSRQLTVQLVLKASLLLMPLGLLFYNPSREAKLPIGANVISVTVADKRITDRHTVLRVTNILFQYNRGYWESGYKNCPQPKVVATFEVKKNSPPIALIFGSSWICVNATFDGVVRNIFWYLPPEIDHELRSLLEINA